MSQINFHPGRPRKWLGSSEKRKANAAIAQTTRRVVSDFLKGRSAEACMSDLVRAAREAGK